MSLRVSDTLNYTPTLLNIFCKQNLGLHICHLNAQSVFPKIDELRNIFVGSDIDIIMISETWLKAEIFDSMITLNDYNVYRLDRLSKRAGGVMLYVKKHLKCKFSFSSNIELTKVEYLFCEIEIAQQVFIVGVVYNPHKDNDLSSLCNDLSFVSSNYQNILIGGDFNLNFCSPNANVSNFQSILDSLNLFKVNVHPTYFKTQNPSLLDIFITANNNKVSFFNQVSLPGFSYHDMIIMTYDLPISVPSSNSFYFYDYNRVDNSLLFADPMIAYLENIYDIPASNVHAQLEILNNVLLFLHHRHVPLVRKRIINTDVPWFNSNIRKLIIDRNKANKNWKRFKINALFEIYRKIRNKTISAIRFAKRTYAKI